MNSILIVLAGISWGSMGIFVRSLSQYGLSSPQITLLRLVIGTLMIAVFIAFYDRELFKIEVRDIPIFAAMGIFSVLMLSLLYFIAITKITMSAAAILLYTSPIWVLLGSVIFYGERFTAKKAAALVCAFGGCVAVSGLSGGEFSAVGILAGLGSGIAYALYSIIGKLALKKYRPLTVTLYSFIFAAIGSLFFGNPAETASIVSQNISAPLAVLIFLLGLITVFVPYILYTIGLDKTPAGKAAIMASAEPMAATVLGVIIYKESLGVFGCIGILLILTAIVLLNIKGSE